MDYLYLTLCVFNAYLSYTATMLNIVAIYTIRKTLSLPKSLKELLLSPALSDLGVVSQVAQNDQGESVQRKRKSAMASFYVYLVFIACSLPDICVLIIIATNSEPRIDKKTFEVLHSDPVVSEFNPESINLLLEDETHPAHYCRHTSISFFKSHLEKAPP